MNTLAKKPRLFFVAVTPSLKVDKWPASTNVDIRNVSLPNHVVTPDLLDFDPLTGEVFKLPKWYVWASLQA